MSELNLNKLLELGRFTAVLRDDARKFLKVGTSALEVIEFIEKRIFDNGYFPAFPATICINEQAAHFTVFDEEVIFKKGDVIKVDFGVSDNGIITDNAFTVELETEKYKKLLDANKEVLNNILEKVSSGVTLDEIGEVSYNAAKKYGFNTIHNLCGHEIKSYDLHAGLSVPNYENGDMSKILDGMELAIEPFLTDGEPMIKEVQGGNILSLKNTRPVRDAIAKKVLNHIIENYPKLPFSKRWLLKEFDKKKVLYALNFLKRNGNVYEYGILVSNNGGMISQFEHTVVLSGGKKYIITSGVE